jgi:hypothetical protein
MLCFTPFAWAQSLPSSTLPVTTSVAGETATVVVGPASNPVADLTLTFDDATGLTPASLGVQAQLVDLTDATLLARLPGALTNPDSAFPLLVTIEPPRTGGLRFARTVRVEVHTHALTYAAVARTACSRRRSAAASRTSPTRSPPAACAHAARPAASRSSS